MKKRTVKILISILIIVFTYLFNCFLPLFNKSFETALAITDEKIQLDNLDFSVIENGNQTTIICNLPLSIGELYEPLYEWTIYNEYGTEINHWINNENKYIFDTNSGAGYKYTCKITGSIIKEYNLISNAYRIFLRT